MDQKIKKHFTPSFKAKVALEAVKETETPSQLASKYAVHPIQIGVWKKKLLTGVERLFSDKEAKEKDNREEVLKELYQKIGRLEVENDFLKKKVGLLE